MGDITADPDAHAAPQIVLRSLDTLVGYARNARTHGDAQIETIKASMVEFGWTNPILADATGIVAGHGRSMAARALYAAGRTIKFPNGTPIPAGMVPVVDCTGWSEAQRRAYILTDNQTALTSGWDMELLRVEIAGLKAMDFDLALTGFGDEEIGLILDGPDADPGPDGDGSGDGDTPNASLADRFGVPPFSVLNAREGWWQDRKRAWLALGIKSELGRGENVDG